jgi:hypothetical protein
MTSARDVLRELHDKSVRVSDMQRPVSPRPVGRAAENCDPQLPKPASLGVDIGNNMITPFRKPEGAELLDWQKEFNKQVNKLRYVIEQVIANFKTWRIMHTDYRRPPGNIPETISAVVALHFYATA